MVDPSTLNLSAVPQSSQGPATPITSAGSTGGGALGNIQYKNVNTSNPLAGALLGAALGMIGPKLMGGGNKTPPGGEETPAGGGQTPTGGGQGGGQGGGNQGGGGSPSYVSPTNNPWTGTTPTGGGTYTGGGGTGTVGGIRYVMQPNETIEDVKRRIEADFPKINGQDQYVVAGSNVNKDGQTEIIAQPNYMIGGGNLTGIGGIPMDGGATTSPYIPDEPIIGVDLMDGGLGGGSGGNYYQDDSGNIYDPDGNLYAYNYGGTYYVYNPDNTWTNAKTGDSMDYLDFVDTISSDGGDYNYDGGDYNYDGGDYSFDFGDYDFGNYFSDLGDSFSDFFGFKEGGLAMATPMMARGGMVKGYDDGGSVSPTGYYQDDAGNIYDSSYNLVYTMSDTPDLNLNTTDNQPLALATGTPSVTGAPTNNFTATGDTTGLTDNSGSGFLNILSNLFGGTTGNAVTGAVLGSLLSKIMSQSGTNNQVSQGVDMSKVGQIAPRTTTFGMGPAKMVPFEQYSVAPQQAQNAPLMSNLGVTGYTPPPIYTYGNPVTPAEVLGGQPAPAQQMASGGMPEPVHEDVPIVEGRKDYRQGSYVQGPGTGQSDDIPAMLADGEYVIDAETVSALGDGSNKAGAKVLDHMRKQIRSHKRAAPLSSIPPKAKSPLQYMEMGKKGAK
jgi:hypothetical protein